MRKLPSDLQHALAAEYVLGTMRGRARQRFEAMVRRDPALANVLAAWEAYLTPLVANVVPVEPPARVWKNIEARIGMRGRKSASWWSSLDFWRVAGVALASVVVALSLVIATPDGPAEGPMMVAVLATPEQVPRIVVEQHPNDMIKVRMVKPWATMATQDLELWVVGKDGKPRSLGVIPYDRDSEMRMPGVNVQIAAGSAIAASLEPKGGSTTGVPTKVVCAGMIARPIRA